MAKQIVNIEIRGSGGSQVVNEFGKVNKASQDFVVNVKKIGGVFGELGGAWGDLVSNIAKGGIWGIMNALINGVVTLYGKWRDSAKEAAEEAKRKTEEMIDANKKLVVSIKEASAAQAAAIDHNLSRREKEIDRVKELTKAEIELARQREIAAAVLMKSRLPSDMALLRLS